MKHIVYVTKFWSENLIGRGNRRELHLDGRIILKSVLQNSDLNRQD
jgi:hypothetical protein